MTVRVRLFAVLRERAGRDEVELELEEGATAADAIAAVGRATGLEDVLERMPVRLAVNREYVEEEAPIAPGDELALVPPVSGGAGPDWHARVTGERLDPAAVQTLVGRPEAGALVTFMGTTRDVERLEYEAYADMAEQRMAQILAECVARHDLCAAAAEHRTGSVPLGEPSVIVCVSAPHRGEAFAGAREAIDRIKAESPIWKREVEAGEGGDEAGRWVEGAVPPSTGGGRERLTHLDEAGAARMVDVGTKPETERRARAEAVVLMSAQTAAALARGDAPKGDVVGTARLAGIQAAKRTGELIPLAHPLSLSHVDLDLAIDSGGSVTITAEAATTARTGVEMEAMTAAAVAALTVYDMVKGLERAVRVERLELIEKAGGRSGHWRRDRVDAESPDGERDA